MRVSPARRKTCDLKPCSDHGISDHHRYDQLVFYDENFGSDVRSVHGATSIGGQKRTNDGGSFGDRFVDAR